MSKGDNFGGGARSIMPRINIDRGKPFLASKSVQNKKRARSALSAKKMYVKMGKRLRKIEDGFDIWSAAQKRMIDHELSPYEFHRLKRATKRITLAKNDIIMPFDLWMDITKIARGKTVVPPDNYMPPEKRDQRPRRIRGTLALGKSSSDKRMASIK